MSQLGQTEISYQLSAIGERGVGCRELVIGNW
jgi:hypothetical protein